MIIEAIPPVEVIFGQSRLSCFAGTSPVAGHQHISFHRAQRAMRPAGTALLIFYAGDVVYAIHVAQVEGRGQAQLSVNRQCFDAEVARILEAGRIVVIVKIIPRLSIIIITLSGFGSRFYNGAIACAQQHRYVAGSVVRLAAIRETQINIEILSFGKINSLRKIDGVKPGVVEMSVLCREEIF